LKTVLADVKHCTSLINQRLEAIQLEMDKGERADYSQFRPAHEAGQAPAVEAHAAKEAQEEEKPSYHRSR